MKLSILNQVPISTGMTANEALKSAVRLAQLGEELDYERYWIAEHHDLYGLACPNPDVMLGLIGTKTNKIRIGSGAVLLPYYKPYRVAETYHLLATLFPGRVDLGIGRAPGGSAEVSMALSDNYLAGVQAFPENLDELNGFIHGTHKQDTNSGKITPTPVPNIAPEIWLLGTSGKSAVLAAEKGMNYTFGHFMSGEKGPEIVKSYRENFQSVRKNIESQLIVAVHVICANTTKEAEDLALSNMLWSLRQEQLNVEHTIPSVDEAKSINYTEVERIKMDKMKENMIIGNPKEVKMQLLELNEHYKADEYMIITITYDESKKHESYRFLSEMF